MNYCKRECIKCEEITRIKNLLHEYNALYRNGQPSISDYQYDQLFFKYKRLVSEHLQLSFDDIPTIDETRDEMLSIDSSYDIEKAKVFLKRVLVSKGSFEIVVEPKIDGISVLLNYIEGKLNSVNSRSFNTPSQNILLFASNVTNTSIFLNEKINITVRGELFMKEDVFEYYNSSFASSRNLVAGLFSSGEKIEKIGKDLNFIVFQVLKINDVILTTHTNALNEVSKYLETIKTLHSEFLNNEEEIDAFCYLIVKNMNKYKKEFNYQIDGIVLKVNDLNIQNELGNNISSPRWAFAIKYHGEEICSMVKGIEIDIGRSGKVVPVIIINEIIYGKKKINRITGHNYEFIAKNNILIGSKVFFELKGDAAPIFLSVENTEDNKNTPFVFPSKCPFCNGAFIQIGPNLYCENNTCKRKILKEMIYSSEMLEIDSLGEKAIEVMVERGKSNFLDFFTMNVLDILAITKSEKNAIRIFNNIQNIKQNIKGDKLFLALGISYVSKSAIKKISKVFDSIKALFDDIIKDEISSYKVVINCIGEVAANNIKDFFLSKFSLMQKLFNVFDTRF